MHKKTLIVNGQKRQVLVTDQDVLTDIIRGQLGLWGTKVGCRLNQCGICAVILNGKLVHSCMIKMAKVGDGSEILTIEGIGTPDNLHPLQAAWVKYGGVQCGFCTPGFIVSSYALLKENPAPTRGQVRAWFQKNRNACRCTGYKVLVDAVMAAAAVMRGEQPIESLGFSAAADGRIFGTYYPRPSAIAKVTGTCEYGADTGLAIAKDALQLALVQAKISHGNILHIDTAAAAKMPGVVAVLTHKDVKGNNRINGFVIYPWNKGDGFDRPILNDSKIFQYGDTIAIVCADTKAHADAAAAEVVVEVEELPAYMNAREAIAADAIEIHP
ncbi:MAG: 2Fe-2S iron-sulfur cluster-binding protein, partial [Clostridiales bacterium]